MTRRKRSPSCPPMPTAAAPMARFCGETTLPSTPPELEAAVISSGSRPASRAARSWSAPNSAFDEVSEPVTVTQSQPTIGAIRA